MKTKNISNVINNVFLKFFEDYWSPGVWTYSIYLYFELVIIKTECLLKFHINTQMKSDENF